MKSEPRSQQSFLPGLVIRRRLLSIGLLCSVAACMVPSSARAQVDPTTNRPVFTEPAEFRFRPNAPVRLRAMYDDRVEQTMRRNIDGSSEVQSQSVMRQSFGHTFPSGTIRVDPGGTLNVHFTNNLDLELQGGIGKDSPATAAFLKKQTNITNLHTHGLHVSPQKFSDNVMLHVNQGKSARYRIQLPKHHAPGTHWYHSHVHGSTATQVENGMLGALIVEEPDGQRLTPEEYQSVTEEKVVVITQAIGNPNPQNAAPRPFLANQVTFENIDPKIATILRRQNAPTRTSPLTEELQKLVDVQDNRQFNAFVQDLNQQNRMDELLKALHDLRIQPATFMVNGHLNPVLEVVLGDFYRLRIVNAGANNGDYKSLYIEKKATNTDDGEIEDEQTGPVPMYLAAMDGINLTHLPTVDGTAGNYIACTKKTPLELAPSNRADVYFMADGVGDYELKSGDQVLMTIEVRDPSFQNIPFDADAHERRLQDFLVALDKNLKELQKTPPYAATGYLHKFNTGPRAQWPDEIPKIKRVMTFSVGGRENQDPPQPKSRNFTINGRDFNELVDVGGEQHMQGHDDYLGKQAGDGGMGPDGTKPWPIRTGTVEQWVIKNTTPDYGKLGNGRHPFHIHVNPFWIVDIQEKDSNGNVHSVRETNPYDPRLNRWQDTVNIPGGGSVTIRHRFNEFDGLFVLHCHILRHEDRGMMINTLIVPNDNDDPQGYFEEQQEENDRINDAINN